MVIPVSDEDIGTQSWDELGRGILNFRVNGERKPADDWGPFADMRDNFLRLVYKSVEAGDLQMTLDLALITFFGAPIPESKGMPEMAARLGEYIGNLIGFDYIGIE